jgi:hypothetical protein
VKRFRRRRVHVEARIKRRGALAADPAAEGLSHSEGSGRRSLVTKSKQEEMMPRKRTPEHKAAEGQDEQAVSAATRASELWIEGQARIFEEFDDVRRWLDRRREALDTARQSFEDLRNDTSIAGLIRVHQEWVIGSMNRLAADIAELNGAVLNIAQVTASRMGRATGGATRDLEQTGHELISAAGSKPGMTAGK